MRFTALPPRSKKLVQAEVEKPIAPPRLTVDEENYEFTNDVRAYMTTFYTRMRRAGVSKKDRKSPIAYALAFYNAHIALVGTTDDEIRAYEEKAEKKEAEKKKASQRNGEELADARHPTHAPAVTSRPNATAPVATPRPQATTPVGVPSASAIALSSVPRDDVTATVTTHSEDGHRATTINAPSSTGRDVDITWTRPIDPASPSTEIRVPLMTEGSPRDPAASTVIRTKGGGKKKRSRKTHKKPVPEKSLEPSRPGSPTPRFISVVHRGPNIESTFVRNGIKFHHISSSRPSEPRYRHPSELPFNHYLPPTPSSPGRPQALRRQHAFYHRSHFDVAWTPEFGNYNNPPMTEDDALPAHFSAPPLPWQECEPPAFRSNATLNAPLFAAAEAALANNTVHVATTSPAPVPSPSPSISRKRVRDEDNDDNDDAPPPRRRDRSL